VSPGCCISRLGFQIGDSFHFSFDPILIHFNLNPFQLVLAVETLYLNKFESA
jgi:hypothetical protein